VYTTELPQKIYQLFSSFLFLEELRSKSAFICFCRVYKLKKEKKKEENVLLDDNDLLDCSEDHVTAASGRQPVQPAPDPGHSDNVQVLAA
jgi:hypothetical protein